MTNFKIFAAGLALLAWSGTTLAQNETDALRYSQLGFGGTARIQGLAGAQTALGADAGTMAGNPAGLGLYRRSEITFSPGFNFNNTSSFLNGNSTEASRNNFNISQFGAVFTDRKADDVIGDWRSGSFGIGFTRLNSFQANTSYSGNVTDNRSLLQSFQDKINNGTLSAQTLIDEKNFYGNYVTLEGLAFENYLIDQDTAGVLYVPLRRGILAQSENITSRGAQNQWDFSYGASYKDKLFVGGSLGLTTVRFEQEAIYKEVAGNEEPYFSSLTLRDYLKTTGTGINLKVGLIYKPIDALRFGGTIQTPTLYGLKDRYSTSLGTIYKPGALPQDTYLSTVNGEFKYNLTTPFRANGGVAYFLGKYGFISADVEYLNYSQAKLSEQDEVGNSINTGYFSNPNRVIKDSYASAINFRVGAEARIDVFRVRAGFARYGDPYKASNLDRARTYFTGGFGLKERNYFLDAAYVYGKWDSYYSPYALTSNEQPLVSTQNKNASFVITGGFNF